MRTMVLYTKAQILKGFSEWNKKIRLNPSEFQSQEEDRNMDLEDISLQNTNDLIDYINK